ncbi:UvrD-helicase domain-containing protein [Leadbettera azotonutricia]|uniref:DNA and RNA helicase n=1 Tax=Leadbettera azotonutricia (strain ATCC BAA-888 / DSM 13862 / ZAS-9) TaxID=545695 RepID=F5YDZ3_LEAAZ|nr:UvrD-helicase domain-containing protein [Leadbettera azotonutricia]AEF81123.1 DNA and RNA helicase [Leadbettera azotonutricia ZAS-9]
MMKITADLHIHSRYSRATSPRLTPASLERWARIKGINLLGTGDCTHPRWLAELRESFNDAEEGFYSLKKKARAIFDTGPALEEGLPQPFGTFDEPRFVLTGEISTIYNKDGRTRKIHHLIILPDFKAAASFNAKLEKIGNINSDGRPILGIDSADLLDMLVETDSRSLLIPAHIWTPWFSALGAKSGFDSIEECYGKLSVHIPAIETGLSSNPPMNWALKSLDKYSIISNSDAHSPDKLGREATLLEMDLSYSSFVHALAPGSRNERIRGTIEFFPQEGKYHYDGHRKCNIYLSPDEAVNSSGICPVCGKPLTRGVMGRVLELADWPVDEKQPCPDNAESTNKRPYYSLIPLKEICAEILGTGSASKKVDAAYTRLIQNGGNEFAILMDMSLKDIEKLSAPGISGELLSIAIRHMRSGKVSMSPGYDGEYGVIKVLEGKSRESGGGLFEEMLPAEKMPLMKEKPKARESPKKNNTDTSKAKQKTAVKQLFTPDAVQDEIISYSGKYAVIIAGPGTGKTMLLAARIARLIRDGINPPSILALSFTVKAAAELKERALSLSGIKIDNTDTTATPTISTFHSLCRSILREQNIAAGLSEDFSILGDNERSILLKEICSSAIGKKVQPRRLGTYIEERKRYLLLPDETSFKNIEAQYPEPISELERLYSIYRDKLREKKGIDFDDLVSGTVRLLMLKEKIVNHYRKKFQHIFVDEYQDINFAQYMLVKLLAPAEDENSPPLWVIGDPNQAIYGFRGSDKHFIDRFMDDYPKAHSFSLIRSFRCSEPIIKAASRLAGANLRGVPVDGQGVNLFRAEYPSAASEAEGIARTIAGFLGGASFFAMDSNAAGNANAVNGEGFNISLSDCAVLIRASALAEPIIKALADHGLPYIYEAETPWWEEEPVKTVLDILRENRSSLNSAPSEEIEKACKTISDKNHPDLKELIQLANLFGDIPSLLDSLSSIEAEGMPGVKREGVRIMTIHASKGLEFNQVFLPSLEEGILPFTLYDKDEDIEEERRILYVAMTRAKQGLWLSWAKSRIFQGRTLSGGPSRFLSELEKIIPLAQEQKILKRDSQLRLF